MVRLICIVLGYVFGLFQTSYIYGRMHGIDIRNHGSGNAGTTNMIRTLGVKAGAITFVGDVLKCMAAVAVMRLFFGEKYEHIMKLLCLYTAAGVILGHNFPFYLGFRGGKGIAASVGFVLSFDPLLSVLGISTFILVFLLTHYVSLGSLIIYVAFVIEIVLLGQNGYFGLEQNYLNEMYGVGVFLMVLAFWMHRANIGRLIRGEERKTYLSKKKK